MHLHGDICGNRWVPGEFGIGRPLARNEDGGSTGVHKVVDARFPSAVVAEKMDDDDICAAGKLR